MPASTIAETAQYLTFRLAQETYALEIGKVREVLDFSGATKVPRTPEFMRGVINLRGSVVPVIDLRLRFGMSATERTVNTCVIITEVAADGGMAVLGALADSVQEVIDLEPSCISPAPKIGTSVTAEFIRGVGRKDDRFLMILDIDRMFPAAEIAAAGREGLSSPAGRG